MVLFVRQEHALTRASRRPEAVYPRLDVVLHDGAERLFVDLAVLEHRRDDCRNYSLKLWHVVLLQYWSEFAAYCTTWTILGVRIVVAFYPHGDSL